MKILFWNIGKLSDRKITLIKEALNSENPDIFCIAEGSASKADCEKLTEIFSSSNYYCYYSPIFYEQKDLSLNYKFKRNGLKVFLKVKSLIADKFLFGNQREDGRIVSLKVFINYNPITIIFLHNKSKSGNREVTYDQSSFISQLKVMVDVIEKNENSGRIIIIGDFNLEPWDNILRHKNYFLTSFILNHNLIKQRKKTNRHFYNPLAVTIFQTQIENLGGTYYNESYGWALYDYVLYDTGEIDILYNVVTEFTNGSKLLNISRFTDTVFLNDQLDHLPIIANIIE